MDKPPLPDGIEADQVLYDVIADDGKRRFIYLRGGGRRGFRHGIPHGPTTDTMSSNAVFALVAEVDQLREELAQIKGN